MVYGLWFRDGRGFPMVREGFKARSVGVYGLWFLVYGFVILQVGLTVCEGLIMGQFWFVVYSF
jgi:hypothetical protein